MAIERSFNEMLLHYVPEELLKNEMVKKDWFLQNIEIVDGWKGGELQVAFKEASASSVAYDALTDENDIGESVLVRGTIPGHKIVTASMQFNHRDLLEHKSGKVSEGSFLKMLPDELNDHVQVVKEIVSSNLLNGKKLARAVADGSAGGVIKLDRPERLMVGQKLEVRDQAATTPVTAYVSTINLSSGDVSFTTTRGGAVAADLSAFDAVNFPYVVVPGAEDKAFTGLKDLLLPAAVGGSANIYGKSKLQFTYLQCHAENGSTITATNIIPKIFDCYTAARIRYKGNPRKVVMSFKNFASCMKQLEASKGAFNVVPGSRKTDLYGYDMATIHGVGGGLLELVAIQEMDDDVIMLLDMSSMKFHTNGLIRRIKSPEGLEYFTKRATSGYKYILDHECFGELMLNAPQKNAIIHSISY
jgi:hypothetical protein